MVPSPVIRHPAAQKLMLSCSLAFSGFLLAQDGLRAAPTAPAPSIPAFAAPAPFSAQQLIPLRAQLVDMCRLFDECHALMLGKPKRLDLVARHPFALISGMLDRGFEEIKSLRGTGELGAEGDLFIEAYAQARRKAERNAHLARQLLVEPTVFESSIDKQGLVALSHLAAQSH